MLLRFISHPVFFLDHKNCITFKSWCEIDSAAYILCQILYEASQNFLLSFFFPQTLVIYLPLQWNNMRLAVGHKYFVKFSAVISKLYHSWSYFNLEKARVTIWRWPWCITWWRQGSSFYTQLARGLIEACSLVNFLCIWSSWRKYSCISVHVVFTYIFLSTPRFCNMLK